MPRITHLAYYPVKGLQGVSLDAVSLAPENGFPLDRCFAIADDHTPFDHTDPQHLRKQQLVVQMKYERLAELGTQFDPDTFELTLNQKGLSETFPLGTDTGKSACEDYLTEFLNDLIQGSARLISGPGISYTDLSTPCISLINLNSVRALEQALGYNVDHRRFRANAYLNGMPAWEEESWLNKTLNINGVELLVYKITDRCAAINVDPKAAIRDNTLQGLKREFGHLNMGVYAKVVRGGKLTRASSIIVTQ